VENKEARDTAAVILNSIERYKRNQTLYFQNVNASAVFGFKSKLLPRAGYVRIAHYEVP